MQEINIKEAKTVVGGISDAQAAANGILSSTLLGYVFGAIYTGNPDPTKWKLC